MQQSLILFGVFLAFCVIAVHGNDSLPAYTLVLSVFSLTNQGVKIKTIKIIMYLVAICLSLYYAYQSRWLPIQIITPIGFAVIIYLDFFRKKAVEDRQEKKA